MSTYRVAEGHDVALGSLAVLSPQPRSEGVRAARRNHAADGSVIDEGHYVELEWSALGSAQMYRDLLAQFGLDSALSAEVTIYVRDETWSFARWNGIAVRPELGQEARWQAFPRQITILIKNLEPVSE